MSAIKSAYGILLASVVSACASAPDPTLYTLEITSPLSESKRSSVIIGLAEAVLPAYARNLQITTAISDVRLEEDDDHRWARPPEEAITSAMASFLEAETGASVIKRPFPSGINPELRVSVFFDRLLRGPEGEAQLSGRYIATGPNDFMIIRTFAINVAVETTTYDAYMTALTSGLRDVMILIADDLAL